ncbi:hypothetical protein LIER_30638 [Lithospermum erythrorhizon]|uniref:Uncharacterized protein n=1 Tax=Lithospermum erythrorhizon TaxID=34254 RepID=A0AAV3RU65_LITER
MGGRWRIGNEKNVKIWGARWLPRPMSFLPPNQFEEISDDALVEELIENSGERFIWHYTKNGWFTVSSAYRLIMDTNLCGDQKVQLSSSSGDVQGCWEDIWGVQVPAKFRNFMWRLASGLLPTRVQLQHRGMKIDNKCPFCFKRGEDIAHAIFKCKNSKNTWVAVGDRKSTWRNYDSGSQGPSTTPSWTKPSSGYIKMNVDAAIHKHQQVIGFGWVIRDDKGQFISAGTKRDAFTSNAEQAELLAIKFAVGFLHQHSFELVIIESDCMTAIGKINAEVEDLSMVGNIVADIKRVALLFRECLFAHARRNCNICAHLMAKSATLGEQIQEWWSSFVFRSGGMIGY